MIRSLTAVYEGGVLRPAVPLGLPEGTTVRLTLDAEPADAESAHREVDAFLQALAGAKGHDDLPDGYDFLDALNANRSPGEQPLFPPDQKGQTW